MTGARDRIKAAISADGEELWLAIKTQHPEALSNAALNRYLTEDMALYIAKNKHTEPETLGFLASDVRFREAYRVKLAIARNPKCPQRVALSLIKYLRIFDLADITRDKRIPSMLRQKVELVITEKMPALPSGIKVALARRACAGLVVRLMEEGDRRVVDSCLESPILTEDHLRKIIQKQATKPEVIHAIVDHPKWSLRYPIKYALLMNSHTPTGKAEIFISEMKTSDLQDLYGDPKVPAYVRPLIQAELYGRGAPLEPEEAKAYELAGDEDEALGGGL